MAMKKRRWHKHLSILPEDRWITVAQYNDILNHAGIVILTRSLSHVFSAAASTKEGVNMRYIANNSREYRIYSMDQFLKSLE